VAVMVAIRIGGGRDAGVWGRDKSGDPYPTMRLDFQWVAPDGLVIGRES